MKFVVGLVALIAILLLAFVAWATGGSGSALVATVLLLAFIGTWGAGQAKILHLPGVVEGLLGWAFLLCLIVIIWAGVGNWWITSDLCSNIDGRQGRVPTGYRLEGGQCIAPPVVTQTAPATTTPKREVYVEEATCLTPCSVNIRWPFRIHGDGYDLEIEAPIDGGKTIKFKYPGHGKFTMPAGNVYGDYKFTSLDPQHPQVNVLVYRRERR